MKWDILAHRVLDGNSLDRYEALAILESNDDELLSVLDAAFKVRQHHFGRNISLHVIRNAKSGSCSENCSFCSQSAVSESDIRRYPMQSMEELIEGARQANKMSAKRYCIVTSGRGPSVRDLNQICEAVRKIKNEMPIQICTSLGLLNEHQARQLRDAGVDRYNHNLEASKGFFSTFCSSHSYSDRCYFCKKALSRELISLAKERGVKNIAFAANIDDLKDYRPGIEAAKEMGIVSPLVDAGLGKEEIRFLSREMGLSTWDKPAMACLASRIPYGTAITAENLKEVEDAEDFLFKMGFRQLRVRHHGLVARIEVSETDYPRFFKECVRKIVVDKFKELGFKHISLDLEGFVSGSMNRTLNNV